MTIHIEQLVESIVRETVRELRRLGVDIVSPGAASAPPSATPSRVSIDLSNSKTPVLTERHLLAIDERHRTIDVPGGTVITPGARDLMQRRGITLVYRDNTLQ